MEEEKVINIDSKKAETIFNVDDEDTFDVEDITRVKNLKYGNEVLHPTGTSFEIDREKLEAFPVEIKYASVFFEPDVGQNGEAPPFMAAYVVVKKQVDKVVFKYELSDWINWYAMRVDTIDNGSHYNGMVAVLTQIPYATYDVERAKELIISYVTEIMSLIHQEEAVLYFNSKIGFRIKCKYDYKDLDKDGNPKFISSDVADITDLFTITATIDGTMKDSAQNLFKVINSRTSYDDVRIPMYLYSKESYSTVCFATAVTYQNHGEYYPYSTETIFKRAVEQELNDAELKINSTTVI